ncbi:hypothetical protein JW865_06430 [Candidatus Bathyarchaeota archaeon]|nr:hypothetical protein [Candidatus Bathyarchaeota archaeon]
MWGLNLIGQYGPPDDRGFNSQMLLLIGIVIIILLSVLIILIFFPRLKNVKASKPIEQEIKKIEEKTSNENKQISPFDVTLRLLNDEEKRVVEAIAQSGGSMLQKDLSYELKLSRVKIHRILVGLIERGVVTAEKHYNTNKITLTDWLQTKNDDSKLT